MPRYPIQGTRHRGTARRLVLVVVMLASALTSAAVPAQVPAHGTVVAGSGAWTQGAKLLADVAANNDYAGRAVALDGDTAVVGAAGADVGANPDQGAAFVYVRAGGV